MTPYCVPENILGPEETKENTNDPDLWQLPAVRYLSLKTFKECDRGVELVPGYNRNRKVEQINPTQKPRICGLRNKSDLTR